MILKYLGHISWAFGVNRQYDTWRLLSSSIFGLPTCPYWVMPSHIHLAIKLCPGELVGLSYSEVLERWVPLFKGPPLVRRW